MHDPAKLALRDTLSAWSSELTSLDGQPPISPQSNVAGDAGSPVVSRFVALGRLLDATYRIAMSSQIGEFEDLFYPVLREYIDFDAAWMGQSTITALGPVLHSSVLFNLPAQYQADWECVKATDPLAARVLAEPGKPAVVSIADPDMHPDFRRFFAQWGIAHAICSICIDPALKTCTHLSLYRHSLAEGFKANEIELAEAVMPNVASAIAMNRIRQVNQILANAGTQKFGVAIANRRSIIEHADPSFADFMLMEWPDWDGAVLPGALLIPSEAGAPTCFAGSQINVDCERIADEVIVRVRSRSKRDLLSPRERSVAMLFGQGNTYKEVARRLGISPSTVRHHLRQAYAKLGIQDKAEISWVLGSE